MSYGNDHDDFLELEKTPGHDDELEWGHYQKQFATMMEVKLGAGRKGEWMAEATIKAMIYSLSNPNCVPFPSTSAREAI